MDKCAKKFIQLWQVSTEDVDDRAAPPSDGGGGGLANALADALRKREQHIQGNITLLRLVLCTAGA